MLLAFDLDNTIVRQDYVLPNEIVNAIKRAKSQGHLVSVLTGRPLVAMTDYLNLLDVTEFYSANHGAHVVGRGGELRRKSFLDAEVVGNVLAPYTSHQDIEFSCIVGDILYVKDPDHERWNWAHTASRKVQRFTPDLQLAADKIVFTTNGLGQDILSFVTEAYPELVTYPWDNGYLEVTGQNSDKGSALQLIAADLDVAQTEVIAFGDGPNDVSMLEWAGTGIAVGPQAHPDVRAAADEHIDSPEKLGVMKWLEENLL